MFMYFSNGRWISNICLITGKGFELFRFYRLMLYFIKKENNAILHNVSFISIILFKHVFKEPSWTQEFRPLILRTWNIKVIEDRIKSLLTFCYNVFTFRFILDMWTCLKKYVWLSQLCVSITNMFVRHTYVCLWQLCLSITNMCLHHKF